uniref:Uncharacterized protein n=1 Tax=Ursus maritimus TaxID=29073 RepID=A0A452TI76_URSMA
MAPPPAAPPGGARSGAGPEWGGFEENIQVIAPKAPTGSRSPGRTCGWSRKVLHSRNDCLHRVGAQL